MRTKIIRESTKPTLNYPCVMEREYELKSQELIVLFINRTTGTILHERGTGWQVGLQAKSFNAEDSKWIPFEGSIKFS